MIKKVILASTILASTLSAQWFVGVDYPISSSMNKKLEADSGGSNDFDFEYKPLILKLGAGTPGDLNMNIYFSTAKTENDFGDSPNALNEFGYDIRKEFGIDSIRGLSPFIQGGVSYGWMDEYFSPDAAINVGLKLGAGISYLVAEQFQFILGLDYKYRLWQPVEYENYYESTTITSSDSGTRIYLGVNFWFGETEPSRQENYYSEPSNSEETVSESMAAPSTDID